MISMSSLHFKEAEKNKKNKVNLCTGQTRKFDNYTALCRQKNGRETTSQIFQGSEVHFKAIA